MAGGGEPGGLPPPGKAGGAGRARTRSAGAALAPPAPAPAVPARPANLDTQAALPAAPHSSASLGRQGGSGGAGGAGSPGTGTPRSPDSPAAVDRFGSLRRFGKRDDADSEHQQLITRISGRSRKEEYKVIREIGFGSRAVVKEAIHLPTSLSCALKCIKKPLPLTPALSTQLSATQQEFVREVEVLRNHPHENICGFLDAFETRGKFVVAMELCRGGTVLERVEQMGHYPEAEAAYCIATVLNAVNFLHSLGIAHRDLKPQNLLYVLPIGNPLPEDSYAAAASLLKICDFGVAGIMARGMSTLIGTPFYLAPEILGVIGSDKKVPQGAGYGVLVDMWSLGCTAYCMLVGQNPFQDCTDFDVLFRRIREARYTPIPAHLGLSPAAESFIRSLLCSNPRDRLTAQQALEHPWIRQHVAPDYLAVLGDVDAKARRGRPRMGESPAADQVSESLIYSLKRRMKAAAKAVQIANALLKRSPGAAPGEAAAAGGEQQHPALERWLAGGEEPGVHAVQVPMQARVWAVPPMPPQGRAVVPVTMPGPLVGPAAAAAADPAGVFAQHVPLPPPLPAAAPFRFPPEAQPFPQAKAYSQPPPPAQPMDAAPQAPRAFSAPAPSFLVPAPQAVVPVFSTGSFSQAPPFPMPQPGVQPVLGPSPVLGPQHYGLAQAASTPNLGPRAAPSHALALPHASSAPDLGPHSASAPATASPILSGLLGPSLGPSPMLGPAQVPAQPYAQPPYASPALGPQQYRAVHHAASSPNLAGAARAAQQQYYSPQLAPQPAPPPRVPRPEASPGQHDAVHGSAGHRGRPVQPHPYHLFGRSKTPPWSSNRARTASADLWVGGHEEGARPAPLPMPLSQPDAPQGSPAPKVARSWSAATPNIWHSLESLQRLKKTSTDADAMQDVRPTGPAPQRAGSGPLQDPSQQPSPAPPAQSHHYSLPRRATGEPSRSDSAIGPYDRPRASPGASPLPRSASVPLREGELPPSPARAHASRLEPPVGSPLAPRPRHTPSPLSGVQRGASQLAAVPASPSPAGPHAPEVHPDGQGRADAHPAAQGYGNWNPAEPFDNDAQTIAFPSGSSASWSSSGEKQGMPNLALIDPNLLPSLGIQNPPGVGTAFNFPPAMPIGKPDPRAAAGFSPLQVPVDPRLMRRAHSAAVDGMDGVPRRSAASRPVYAAGSAPTPVGLSRPSRGDHPARTFTGDSLMSGGSSGTIVDGVAEAGAAQPADFGSLLSRMAAVGVGSVPKHPPAAG